MLQICPEHHVLGKSRGDISLSRLARFFLSGFGVWPAIRSGRRARDAPGESAVLVSGLEKRYLLLSLCFFEIFQWYFTTKKEIHIFSKFITIDFERDMQ